MKRWLVVIMALSLLLFVILPACGGGVEKTPAPTPTPTVTPNLTLTATPSPTSTATHTPTATPTSTSAGPVKIGVIGPWSGPMAMAGMLTDQGIAVVGEQIKNMGGILGGREVKFIRADDRGVVAESQAQAKKLILEDKVTILTVGSVSGSHMTAVADVAEELKVPFVSLGAIYGIAAMKYCALMYGNKPVIARAANFIENVVKPKTVAFLGYDAEDAHVMLDGVEGVEGLRDHWKNKGIDIVYEQFYPQGTADFSPYLTKIKYLKPDLLIGLLNDTGQAITLHKQMLELGGWGSMKYFAAVEPDFNKTVINMPSSVGIYLGVLWLPGSDEPGMKAFEDAFKQKYGRLPDANISFYYNCFWTAIKAIELAGTDDPDKVAQALRSGNLEWDSAWGPLRIAPDGEGEVNTMVVQVQEGGKLVKVWPPQ